ncbi:MAG: LON peptidase substrate-binding domain-containing protein [Actinomycetota bacterium]
MAPTPQFPLGTVLFPTMVLPLHVFEMRYRALVKDVLDGDNEFGVALIERGSEVGGGDQRTQVGTLARVVQAEELADGRWAVVTVGSERFRVQEWLDDAPYPRAEIELWPDEAPGPDAPGRYADVTAKFKRCLALASESGVDVGPVPETADDVTLGSMQMSALAPVTTHDKQRLLAAPGPDERLTLLNELLDDTLSLIEARLAGP